MLDLNVALLDPSERLKSLPKRSDTGLYFRIVLRERMQEHDASHALGALRPRLKRPRRRAAQQRDELAALCMSGKQHSEGRRGFGHDRVRVATGSPQALRILNRE